MCLELIISFLILIILEYCPRDIYYAVLMKIPNTKNTKDILSQHNDGGKRKCMWLRYWLLIQCFSKLITLLQEAFLEFSYSTPINFITDKLVCVLYLLYTLSEYGRFFCPIWGWYRPHWECGPNMSYFKVGEDLEIDICIVRHIFIQIYILKQYFFFFKGY